jgi:hypothetical protein
VPTCVAHYAAINSAHGCSYLLNSPLAEGLFGAVIGAAVGSLITGFFILWQTNRLLKEERLRSEEERERETKSLAAALLWEIDDFYKLSLRDVCRALKHVEPSTLGFHAKSATYTGFVVFEANADKIGLFEPLLIQAIILYYGVARAYLNTASDYGQTMLDFQGAMQTHMQSNATLLLAQVREFSGDGGANADGMRTICRAGGNEMHLRGFVASLGESNCWRGKGSQWAQIVGSFSTSHSVVTTALFDCAAIIGTRFIGNASGDRFAQCYRP